MSFIARSKRHRLGHFESDVGLAVYDGSAVLGIGLGWGHYASELWEVRVELSLGPVVLWVRVCHYRKIAALDAKADAGPGGGA